ncbi:MAG: D-alanine--D-alanine ligase [Candidatus Omnitrophica bacterium]|nr:D-alanine--D-alanine ligase [Candidatus Omnitrophota bacterium]
MAGTGNRDSKVRRFKKVGVLAGGPSSERDISLASGEAVNNALLKGGVNSVFIDVRERVRDAVRKSGADAVFIALHGGFGEDGTVQSILEKLKIPYTGSGPDASRLALDKLASREIFRGIGIDVPKYKVLKKNRDSRMDSLNMPVVVKPQKEGSSVGLSVVFDLKRLKKAIDKAFDYGDKILIEEFIRGRELTVGILADKPLPVIEIVPEGDLYDYYAKYESPKTKYLVPAPITDKDFDKAKEIGLKAHKTLGCRYFSRVDMVLGDDGRIYVLEVNTIPGLTSRSLLPKAALVTGVDFCGLCIKILEASTLNGRRRSNEARTYGA